MNKIVVNSSVIIALSSLGYINKLKPLFKEVVVAKAVYEEICSVGKGLVGSFELEEAAKSCLIEVKDAKNQLLVTALLDPLAIGEAETIVLAVEECADGVVLDDKAARSRAIAMKLNVIGTLRILRMMYDAKIIDRREIIQALMKLRETGFRVSDDLVNEIKSEI